MKRKQIASSRKQININSDSFIGRTTKGDFKMVKVMIELDTEKSAEYVKNEVEKLFPTLDGRISIYKEPSITTLDKAIEEMRRKEKQK
jgi:hypothetical protein